MSEEETTQTEEEKAAAEAEKLKPVRDAFDAAISADKEEDEVKMAMIQAGAKFKNVTRLYNQFMVDAGLAVSKEKKDETVTSVCEGQDLSQEEVFNGCVADIANNLEGVNEKSAAALIRAYAKKNELECYKKPKGEGAGKSGFAAKFYTYISGEQGVTTEQAKAFIMGTDGNEETSNNVRNHLSHYMNIHSLVEKAVSARS